MARAYAVQPRISLGQVKLPATNEPWVRTFLDEAGAFPLGGHDDMVDAFTEAMLVAFELSAKWAAMQVQSAGPNSGWIDARYIDRDTRSAPSPNLVRRNPW